MVDSVMYLIVSSTPEALAERAAADFAALVRERLLSQERFYWALAGGSTPKDLYARLAQEPYRSSIPWSRIWVLFGDERCVPPDHRDSNFRMAQETLLSQVPVPSRQVLRIRGEDPPPVAARAYENRLRELFGPGADWPAIDLALLGLGTQGHTASLFPDTPAMMAGGNRWVVGNVIRSLQTVRVTLTLEALNRARSVWFLVTGAKKKPIFAQVRQGPQAACPASLVRPVEGELRWYVDQAVVE